MKLSDFFFFSSRLSSREEAILTATQGASQPSVPSLYVHTHFSSASALTCRRLREEIREVKD